MGQHSITQCADNKQVLVFGMTGFFVVCCNVGFFFFFETLPRTLSRYQRRQGQGEEGVQQASSYLSKPLSRFRPSYSGSNPTQ